MQIYCYVLNVSFYLKQNQYIGYADLMAGFQRLHNELTKQGKSTLASRLATAQQMIAGPKLASTLDLRTVMLQRRRPRVHNPVCSNAQMLAKDVGQCKIYFLTKF